MNRKGLSAIYWFIMAIAIILIVGIAWMSTEISPLEYTAETGRQQAIVFKMYVEAEQIRSYSEEAITSAAFYTLQEMGISETKLDCFNRNDFYDLGFNNSFSKYVNDYIEALPLETPYSDLIPPTYGPFKWSESLVMLGEDDASVSRIESIDGGTRLKVSASPDGDIVGLNSIYAIMYFARGELELIISCQEYREYMNLVKGNTDIN